MRLIEIGKFEGIRGVNDDNHINRDSSVKINIDYISSIETMTIKGECLYEIRMTNGDSIRTYNLPDEFFRIN